jgi:competence protein ComEC
VVLTGDSNEINEPIFVRRIGGKLDCDVLKVGHHGSATSSTAEFLDAITCEYAVISCNKEGNTFVHPRQVTLDRFKARNMSVYRTDKHGSIVLTIDGKGELKFTVDNSDVTDEEIFKGADTENAEATLSALSFTLPLFAQLYI